MLFPFGVLHSSFLFGYVPFLPLVSLQCFGDLRLRFIFIYSMLWIIFSNICWTFFIFVVSLVCCFLSVLCLCNVFFPSVIFVLFRFHFCLCLATSFPIFAPLSLCLFFLWGCFIRLFFSIMYLSFFSESSIFRSLSFWFYFHFFKLCIIFSNNYWTFLIFVVSLVCCFFSIFRLCCSFFFVRSLSLSFFFISSMLCTSLFPFRALCWSFLFCYIPFSVSESSILRSLSSWFFFIFSMLCTIFSNICLTFSMFVVSFRGVMFDFSFLLVCRFRYVASSLNSFCWFISIYIRSCFFKDCIKWC